MNNKENTKEKSQTLKEYLKIFFKETIYYAGNLKYLFANILHVIISFRIKILGAVMLAVPALYFDEGQILVLNLIESITNKGLIDIFILFAVGSIIITWCSFAIYFIIFK